MEQADRTSCTGLKKTVPFLPLPPSMFSSHSGTDCGGREVLNLGLGKGEGRREGIFKILLLSLSVIMLCFCCFELH